MGKKWARVLKFGLPAVVVAGLVAGLALPALAAPKGAPGLLKAPANIVAGQVLSKAADSFVVQSANQTQTTVHVNSDTKYFKIVGPLPKWLPGFLGGSVKSDAAGRPELQRALTADLNQLRRAGQKATFGDVEVGDRVLVRLVPGQDVAREVLITKTKPPAGNIQTVAGKIALVTPNSGGTGGSITITKASTSTQVTLNWDADTRFILKGLISVQAGQSITAVYNATTLRAITVTVRQP